ncbi:CBS domain-containing protein [Metallosphaera hakonensis JCM 8857 = DSM 7519]|uniref:Sodium:proton antiporter n=2 Tax=Metallosphaera hakonensis TaxID=79601 RepID=A0A2U9IXI7_9CREN|nr:CBS domain-containing protein [Metallosphaera hakonensis JCM 8857 = DSM 7519]
MLFLAKLAEEGFSRIGLTPFVGAVVVGIILGNGLMGIIVLNSVVSFITSLGIVFLLFLAGAEEIGGGLEVNSRILISSILLLIIPSISVFYVLYFLHIIGDITILFPLIMTSVGPLTRLLMDTGMSKSEIGRRIFYQGTVVEILSVILFIIFLNTVSLVSLFRVGIEIPLIFLLILLTGPKIAKALESLEGYVKVREIELASVISVILITGYVADVLNFSSAIAALFLGFLLRGYLRDRPDLLEKIRGLTYGFFEPLFFVSIGLYFVKITPFIAGIGFFLALIILLSKFIAGFLGSFIVRENPVAYGLGTSTKGGVDASLLITALVLHRISYEDYSYAALSLTVLAIVVPILFKLEFRGRTGTQQKRPRMNEKIGSMNNFPPPLYAKLEETLRDIINKMTERGARAIIVVDDRLHPMGYITVQQLLEIDPGQYETLRASDLTLNDCITVSLDARIIDVLRKFRSTETPVIAMVDRGFRLAGTIYERELLRVLTTL